MMMDGMNGGMGGMMPGMLLWGLVGLALLVLIIVVITWLIRHTLTASTTGSNPAEEELRRRYAAGEIDHDEYQRRRAELRKP